MNTFHKVVLIGVLGLFSHFTFAQGLIITAPNTTVNPTQTNTIYTPGKIVNCSTTCTGQMCNTVCY